MDRKWVGTGKSSAFTKKFAQGGTQPAAPRSPPVAHARPAAPGGPGHNPVTGTFKGKVPQIAPAVKGATPFGIHQHPAARGVNHGEAAASHTEKAANQHGTPAPHSQAHAEADRRSMGHRGPSGESSWDAWHAKKGDR